MSASPKTSNAIEGPGPDWEAQLRVERGGTRDQYPESAMRSTLLRTQEPRSCGESSDKGGDGGKGVDGEDHCMDSSKGG